MADDKKITLEIFRYIPDDGQPPRFDTYQVPYKDDWVVLDAINHIKEQIDPSLAYRWSCRMGVCGSCGMMVNGEPKLTCSAFLKDYYPGPVRVEPLINFPVERDLVIDMDHFMAKLDHVQPYIVRDDVDDTSGGEYLQTPAELAKYKQFTMCINCMLCYAACPVMGLTPEFIGPAALALGQRYNADNRDHGQHERLDRMMESQGVWGCTFVGECSVVCPKHVDPAGAIQQAKIEATKQWYKSFLAPKGAGK